MSASTLESMRAKVKDLKMEGIASVRPKIRCTRRAFKNL